MKRILFKVSTFLALTVSVLAINWPNPVNASRVSQVNGSAQGSCRKGNGILKTENRNVGIFTAVDVSGSYDVETVAQQPPSLTISGDANILPQIITEVRGDTLFVYNRGCISPKTTLKLKIASRKIEEFSASGANRIKIFSLNNQTFNLAQSGGAQTEVFGKTTQLDITVTGAGTADAKKLYSQRATVEISGAGLINVYATEKLSASIVGSGVINYYGNPKTVTRNIIGVGSINKK
jgi:hypothetical protein